MSILVLSVSHKTTAMSTLSRMVLDPAGASKLGHALARTDYLDEVVVLSTCNRTEVHAGVSRFHGGLADLSREVAAATGLGVAELHDACSVYYDEAAVAHTFSVAAGLDSMVVGESQVLGQVRSALTRSQHDGTVGTVLNALFQQAMRVGKRVQAETGIGRAGRSLVGAALDRLTAQIGPLAGRTVLVLGAGSMAALAGHTLADAEADVVIANRTAHKAERLAERIGATTTAWALRRQAMREADVVVACTGARGLLIEPNDLAGSRVRGVVDLALPADVDPALAEHLPLVNLEALLDAAHDPDAGYAAEIEAARGIVAAEVADFLASRRAARVAPTVVALRSMAAEVTAAELARLETKLPGLTERERAEIGKTVHRVADKLLHAPTVRVQQIRDDSEVDYAAALRELFALDPKAISAVITPQLPDQPDVAGDAGEGRS